MLTLISLFMMTCTCLGRTTHKYHTHEVTLTLDTYGLVVAYDLVGHIQY